MDLSLNAEGSSQRADGRPMAAADVELFSHIERKLYTAVLSDALDDMCLRDCAMRERLRPLSPDMVFARLVRRWRGDPQPFVDICVLGDADALATLLAYDAEREQTHVPGTGGAANAR